MLLRILFFILLYFTFSCALELKKEYIISSQDFNLSHVDPSISQDIRLYRFDDNRYQKSFNTKTLITKLQNHGISIDNSHSGVIYVKRRHSLNLSSLKEKIKAYYLRHYDTMKIHDITIKSNSFIAELPNDFSLSFKKSAYLYARSSLQLQSKNAKKRLFLNYEIKASIKVFKASHNINRGKILSQTDFSYAYEVFKRFTSIPVQHALQGRQRLKKRLVSGKILYHKDLEALPDVLKNKTVNVRLISGSVHLEFQAISMEDGHVGDEIMIKKRDGTRLKAKVVSPNLVEIQ